MTPTITRADILRKRISIAQIAKHDPCYSEDNMLEASGGKRSGTLLEFVSMESLPVMDILWALGKTKSLSDRALRLIACDFAEHVLPDYEAKYPNDNRPRRAIEVSRLYADGKATEKELTAARAALAAVSAAAWAAASAATWAAAKTAEEKWQRERLKQIIEEVGK